MKNQELQKKNNRLIVIVLLGAVLFTALVLYFGMLRPHFRYQDLKNVKIDGVFLPTPQEVADFNLTDNTGKPFSKENLKGHWTMMFFGFTNCGMVCPTTMAALNKMYVTLQSELPAQKLPQVVLVSVDPANDSVERMNSYVKSFNPSFMGARTGEAETVILEKQMHIAAAKMQAEGQGKDRYTINHTAEILVINPEAKLQAFLSYPHQPEQMVKDYKLILKVLNG